MRGTYGERLPAPVTGRALEARLLDALEQAVVATDVDGTIVYWNRSAESLYGWAAEEVVGRTLSQVVPSNSDAAEAEELTRLRAGEHRHGEREVRRKDGSTFTSTVTDSPLVVDGDVVGVVRVSADVSQRRSVVEELRASERRLRAVFASIDEGYCLAEMLLDDAGRPADYRFLEVNPLFEQMTGLFDAVGRTALELVPDLEPTWVDTYARVGVGRETLRFEQGSAAMGRWFDVFALPVDPAPRFAIVFKDQTLRRQAEDALRESEERFRTMADGLPLLVWQHGPDGAQEWVNQTFCDFFGVQRDEMVAGRWQALTDPETGPDYATAFLRAVSGRTPFRAQVRAQDGAGRWRWLQSWAEPRYSTGGDYLGHLGVSADVTDRVEAEETLRQNHEFITELTALVPGVLYVFDLDERRNVFVNRAAEEALGLSPEQVSALGDRFLPEVVHPEDVARFEAHLDDVRRLPDGRSSTLEYRFRHATDGWRWFSSRDVVLDRDAQGRARQILGIATDVTARKAEEATAHAAADLDAYRAHLLDSLRRISDPEQLQTLACRLLGEHLRATGVHYAQILQDGRTCVVEAGFAVGDARLVGTYRLDQYGATLMEQFRAGSSIAVADAGRDDRLSAAERRATTDLGVRAYAMTPLSGAGEPVAALIVYDENPRDWSSFDLETVDITAERTWAAVEQARAYQAARSSHRRAELIADVVGALEGETTAKAQLQRLAETLVPRLADYATVEAPGEAGVLRAVAHRDPERAEALRTSGTPQQGSVDTAPRSETTVPLHLGDLTAGALTVGISDPGRDPHTPEDVALLQEIAHRAEVILTATRLRRREHDIAVRLQRAMLPDHLVQHPRVQLAARYQAAAGDMLEVGGDWYDTFAWPSGHIGVIVGDVVGHNLESAAAMGRLRAATAAVAAHVPPDPAALLDAVNHFAGGSNGTEFATAVCLVIDPDTGHVAYCSAGHPPPLVVEASGRTAWLDAAQQVPLATTVHAYSSSETRLGGDSLLVVYSDGLVERRHEPIDTGLARLRAAVLDAQRLHRDPEALADHLLDAMTAQSPTDDDIVLVCLRLI